MDLLEKLQAAQQWLLMPLVVLLSVHSLWRLCRNVKDNARLFVRRVQEALERERERLIEDIKADLLKTLNKGSRPLELVATGLQPTPEAKVTTEKHKERRSQPSFEYARRLDRKDKSNIVNEIIYQIQSGDSNRNCTDDDKVVHRVESDDSAVLKDVHRRNVVARMKNLFESNETNKWQLNRVVDIISQKQRPLPLTSTSMENLRAKSLSIPKAASEPPVVRLRRKIRSQQNLSESSNRDYSDIASSIEDILEAERFSKRLSQYSISEYLDEDSPRVQEDPSGPDFNRVGRGIKTLSTFSLSELLRDDEPECTFEGVTLRREAIRKPVESIDQILIDENLSRCYSQYSISDLVDDDVVFLQDYPAPLVAQM